MTDPADRGPAEGVKFTDKRRIDPSGTVRPVQVPQPPADLPVDDSELTPAVLDAVVAEVTADLQRVQAEYANYRKRVQRDREQIGQASVASTLGELVPLLDDIGRAREHGELEGAFRAVGETLEALVAKLGLERFGEIGERFDPTVHEALTHTLSEEVSGPVCIAVYQPGYRFAGRVVRPARVGVADPVVDPVVDPLADPVVGSVVDPLAGPTDSQG